MTDRSDVVFNQTAHQLSLDIFAEALGKPPPITDAPASIGFMKSHATIDVSDLSLAARKALNVCHFIACADLDRATYEVDVGYFKWMINMPGTKNMAYLRKMLRDAQKSAVQVNIIDSHSPDKDLWLSVQMIATTGIANGRVVFSIPEHFKQHLRNDVSRSFLSFRISGGLTSLYSAELYERLLPYAEAGATSWLSLDEVRKMVGIGDQKSGQDFRYLKRDIINCAVDQINSRTDLRVEVLTKNAPKSRRVEFVMFKILRQHSALNYGAGLKELNVVLRDEFGLTDDQIDDLTERAYTPERIWEAVEYTRYRISKNGIDFPGKYLLKAIDDGYRLPSSQKQKVVAEKQIKEVKKKTTAEVHRKAASEELPFEAWQSWPPEKLDEAWCRFMTTSKAKLVCGKKKGLDREALLQSRLVLSAFSAFLNDQDK